MTMLKWALASDIHFPYHERRYVDLWFKVIKAFKPDVIDYLGDISDQDCFARFNVGHSNEFLNLSEVAKEAAKTPIIVENETVTREFYRDTRKQHKKAEIFSALGNHDIRVFTYADKNFPEENAHITPDALWDFKNLGIDYIHYSDLPKHRFGDVYTHHGISALKHSAHSVQEDMANLGVSLIRGHSHRQGAFFKSYELRGETLRGYEIGHMTDIKSTGMLYTNVHNWQPGFAIAHIESGVSTTKDGLWPHIQLIQVSPDFTCVIDGKKFEA